MNRAIMGVIGISSLGLLAPASGQPAAHDYGLFSQFISARNIFNPGRQAFTGRQGGETPEVSIPATRDIQLVGTMSYEKGVFAFFSGNSTGPDQVLQAGDRVGGCTIQSIRMGTVSLEPAGQVKPVELNIGNGLRDENGQWVFSTGSEMRASGSGPDLANESNSIMPVPPPSAGGQNNVLKRLMEQREKENQ